MKPVSLLAALLTATPPARAFIDIVAVRPISLQAVTGSAIGENATEWVGAVLGTAAFIDWPLFDVRTQ